jgi:tetratricopeptide (TPR) repeat protein
MSSEKIPDRPPDIPDLQPPRPEPDQQPAPAAKKRGLLLLLLVAFTFFLLLDLAILAYFLWPEKKQVDTSGGEPGQERQVIPDSPLPEEKQPGTVLAEPAGRQQAEAVRVRWFGVREEGEAARVGLWAGEESARLLAKAAEAGKALAAGNPQQAADFFAQAADGMRALLDSRPDRFAQAMEEGRAALARGKAEEALADFSRALAIRPGDAAAQKGLDRAQSLDQVVALYTKALQAEQNGQARDAISFLEQAVRIDPDWDQAGQALERIRQQVLEERFSRAMADFHQAMLDKNSEEAAGHLARAARIRPDSPHVAQGNKELALLRKQQQLTRLGRRLGAAESGEEWQKVQAIAGQMLRLDPDSATAREAGKKAEKRAELDQRLVRIIKQPERLAEEAVLAEAKEILAVARATLNPGPRLAEQIQQVEGLVARAERPVTVTLRSDGATEVIIYHVGRMGSFAEKRVQLRPGRYTVVGTRPGFRDVRREIMVRADRNEPLLIRCTETI